MTDIAMIVVPFDAIYRIGEAPDDKKFRELYDLIVRDFGLKYSKGNLRMTVVNQLYKYHKAGIKIAFLARNYTEYLRDMQIKFVKEHLDDIFDEYYDDKSNLYIYDNCGLNLTDRKQLAVVLNGFWDERSYVDDGFIHIYASDLARDGEIA